MADEAPKRRLPVLQDKGDPPEEERPPWHWVGFGAFATFLVWLPLSALVEVIVKRTVAGEEREALRGEGLLLVGGHAVAFFLGALAGGVLVARVGAKTSRKQAALAGGLAGATAWIAAAGQGMPGGALVWGLMLAILIAIGTLAGLAGGVLGLRWKARAQKTAWSPRGARSEASTTPGGTGRAQRSEHDRRGAPLLNATFSAPQNASN